MSERVTHYGCCATYLLLVYARLGHSLYRTNGSPIVARAKGAAERTAMKLTVDSSEPLEDALRVVGALYGVTIVVSENGSTVSQAPRKRTAQPRNGTSSTNRRPRTAAAGKPAGKARNAKGSRAVAQPTNAEVRSWARDAGLNINGRGRVPASVMAAYRDAHK